MTNENIDIRGSSIHRHGAFAKRDIPKGTFIIEYTGRRITKDESAKILDRMMSEHQKDSKNNAGTYIFDMGDWDLDGDTPDNDAKWINHSCEPNCRCDITPDNVYIYSIKDIKKGEEITYNYCFVINDDDPYDFMNHPCKCASKKCVGYILDEAEWPRMKELLKKKHQ